MQGQLQKIVSFSHEKRPEIFGRRHDDRGDIVAGEHVALLVHLVDFDDGSGGEFELECDGILGDDAILFLLIAPRIVRGVLDANGNIISRTPDSAWP